MARWIASDATTADALRDRRIQSAPGSTDLIADAMQGGSAVLVLPGDASSVVVARIRREVQPPAFQVHRWTDEDAVGYTAGGMLGLMDEPVYEEEPPAKKKWWQRILE